MLASALFAAATAAVGDVDAKPPPIPALAQELRMNFSLDFPGLNFNPGVDMFTGYIEIDVKDGGGRMHVQGEDVVPVYFATSAIAVPCLNNETVTAYSFSNNVCWVSNQAVNFLKFFPLEIPADATFGGYSKFAGQKVEQWQWSEDPSNSEFGTLFSAFVTTGNPAIILQVNFSSAEFPVLSGVFTLTNTKIGPVPAKDFTPPKNLKCVWVGDDVAITSVHGAFMRQMHRLRLLSRVAETLETAARENPAPAADAAAAAADADDADDAAPAVPSIAQIFTANYTVEGVLYGVDETLAMGWTAVDYTKGGFFILFNSSQSPVFAATQFTLYPHGQVFTGYWYFGDICWSSDLPPGYTPQTFPLHIPKNATYVGKETIDGKPADCWKFPTNYYASGLTYCVRDADHALVRIIETDTDYESQDVTITFTNVVLKCPASRYAPPNQRCAAPGDADDE